MTEQFEKIILKIAKLPPRDQLWILRQLPAKNRNIFQKLKGFKLWRDAQDHRAPQPQAESGVQAPVLSLPEYSGSLTANSPLYAAIILSRGYFPWQSLFLETFDSQGQIHYCLTHQIGQLKPAVIEAVWDEWRALNCG